MISLKADFYIGVMGGSFLGAVMASETLAISIATFVFVGALRLLVAELLRGAA